MKECDCDVCGERGCLCDPYSRFFSVLANTNRLHIINALRSGDKNVTEICRATGIEQSCASHCLRMLQEHGLVSSRQDGKFRVYSLEKETGLLMAAIDGLLRDEMRD